MPSIQLPAHGWRPRPYQEKAWDYLTGPTETPKRAFLCWARRSGKDELCLNYLALASQLKVATYWYMGPTTTLARGAFWDAINPHTGRRRFMDAFIGPYEPDKGLYGLIANKSENEMTLDLVNGSTVRFCGSDNYENLLGAPPFGLIFSEYARANPMAWNLLRPILAENGGFAIFNTTPLGENHAATLYRFAESDPNWFAELLPATQTGVFSKEVLEQELHELIEQNGEDQGRAIFDQEFMCSFNAQLVGSIFGKEIEKASLPDPITGISRITNVPYDPRLPVHISFDLGFSDATAIWFVQMAGPEIRVIDYLEDSNQPLDFYAKAIKDKGYLLGQVILPHDAQVRELGSGRSRLEILRSLGLNGRVLPNHKVQDGIAAVKSILPMCWFDKVKCKRGLDALRNYRRTWDEKRKVYSDQPYHDWTSHAADSLRYFAMGNVRNASHKPMVRRSQGFV